jgi:hypothetical protein
MFELLGTAPEHKRRITCESSHRIPRNELIKEVVNWMDKYWVHRLLGPPTPQQ